MNQANHNNVQTSIKPIHTSRLKLALLLGSLASFGPLTIDMYLPSFPDIATDFQTSISNVQLSLTACLIGLALGQLIAGPLSDVRGRRAPLLIGLFVYAVASSFCIFSSSIWTLIVLRFVQGLAGAAGIVISRAVARDLYSGSELTKFFALLMLVNGAAPIFAPIIGGQLLRFTNWHGVFVVLTCLSLFILAAVWFSLPETLAVEQRSRGGMKNTIITFRSLVSDWRFTGYALSQGFVMGSMFAYISGSPFVIQDIYGASAQMFSLFFAVNGLGFILAGQSTGRLAEKVGEKKLLIIGLCIAASGGVLLLVMILLDAGLPAVLMAFFMIVSSVGIVSTSANSLAMQTYGHSAGSAAAMLGLISMIMGGLFAPLVGLGGSGTALPLAIVIFLSEMGAILCYFVLVRRLTNKRESKSVSV